jgi:heme-degrading monooxygenase HmoA
MWEFTIDPDFELEFVKYYNSAGIWAELFRKHPGYIETLLFKDAQVPGRYLSIDRWQSEESFHAFKAMFAKQYEDIDQQCENFTLNEISLGSYYEIQQ